MTNLETKKMISGAVMAVAALRLVLIVYWLVMLYTGICDIKGLEVVTGLGWYNILRPAFWVLVLSICEVSVKFNKNI